MFLSFRMVIGYINWLSESSVVYDSVFPMSVEVVECAALFVFFSFVFMFILMYFYWIYVLTTIVANIIIGIILARDNTITVIIQKKAEDNIWII